MRNFLALLSALALAPTLALAQSSSVCERREVAICGASSASLGETMGDVVVLSNTAVAPAQSGSVLIESDRVIARAGATEIVLGPDCRVAVPQTSSALVYRERSNRMCVEVSDLRPAATPANAPTAPSATTPSVAPYALGAAGVVGGAAAIALGLKGRSGGGSSTPVSGQ